MGIHCVAQGTQTWVCNNLEGQEGVGGGRKVKREGMHIYLWLTHTVVWQRPTLYYEAIFLQLKMNKFVGRGR